jgi:hypothetical protein
MAIPNYTYLKLKMPGTNGVIAVRTTYQHAYKCDVECCEYTEAIIEYEALVAKLEARLREAPDPKRSTSSFDPSRESRRSPSTPTALTTSRCTLAPPWIL